MKNNEETNHLARDDNMLDIGQKETRGMMPRLRKNRRLEKRWGDKYCVAVKEAVFMFRATPHMPLDIPLSLHRESDDCEQLYVCKQCNDCFRFLSSLEAHNSRRSWILGYWCHNCFFIDCKHSAKGQPPCFECQTMNRQRTLFLRSKGLRKGRKMGSIKIFYNQCQFYAHLRMHETTVVDMADLMLMPVPTDVDKKSYNELEHICETIMERMFLTRTHIMDWLKSHQLGNDWWRVLQSNSINDGNPLDGMLGTTTRRTRGINKSVKNALKSKKILSTDPASSSGSSSFKYPPKYDKTSSISEIIESVISQSNWEESDPLSSGKIPVMPPLSSFHHIDRSESIEDDDNPCTTADIAFVDCGPAAKTYPPDVAIVLPPKDKLTIIPNGSNSGHVMPVKNDSHSSSRVSGNPLLLKQHQANNVVRTSSSSAVSAGSHRTFEPKISVKKFANERLSVSPDINCEKNYPRMNNETPQAVRKLTPVSNIVLSGGKRSLPSVRDIARAVETSKKVVSQASLSNLGSKILTVHTPKNTDLSKIISQLPPEVINGKKIVFIGQDSERFTILPKNDTSSSSVGMIKIQSDIEKPKIVQTPQMKIAPMVALDIESEQTKKKPPTDNIKPKIQPVYIDGKVIYQNGKKFIIRQARKNIPETTVCTNINNLKLQTIPRHVSLSTFLANPQPPLSSCIPISPKPIHTGTNKIVYPLTSSPFTSCSTSPSLSSSPSPSLSPSPSTSENPKGLKRNALIRRLRTNSDSIEILAGPEKTPESPSLTSTPIDKPPTCHVHTVDAVEYFAIHKNSDGSKSYVDFSSVKKEIMWTQTTQNWRQQMLEKFRRCGQERAKQLIDHLNDINTEFTKILGVADDERISDNLKAIRYLETVFKEESTCSDDDQDTEQLSSVNDINTIISNLKETRERTFVCPTCNRSIEPGSHILEFSKGSAKNLACSNCNIYVCYVCNVYQGNISRYRAHINFHAKREPYNCPECFRKFPTYLRLQTHVWSTCFHPLIRKWFKCKVCLVEGFPNMESVTEHFILAHSKLKIACPECGLLLKSEHDFENHAEEDHPKVINRLKPVNLMVCDIGSCVVRVENFRSHMDHHSAVNNLIHYKCPFCSYLVQAMKRGREQIRAHLHANHSERLPELGNFEKVQPDSSNQSDNNLDMHDISMIDLCSGENDHEHLDASSSKKTLKDDANRSTCRLDSRNTEESPASTDLGTDSLEITTTMKQAVDTPNIIMEYSSSPKIFDVRSVTPDSYAELGVGTKEQINLMGKTAEGTVQSVSGTFKEGVEATDSFLIKMGDQYLHMNLVVNQAEGNRNLSEMLQSPITTPNTFIKLSDLSNSDETIVASNNFELATNCSEPEKSKKITSASATVRKFQGSVEKWPSQSVNGKKQMLSISVLKSKTNSIANSRTDITEPETHVIDLHAQVDNESPIITNSWGNCDGITADPLLCNLPKPPPLVRIPQHLLDLSRVKDEVSEEEVEEIKVTTPRSVVRAWRRQRRPWRIALNSPIQTLEIINYRCHLCGEAINTSWSVLENHFNSRHSEDYKLSILTPRLLNMSSDFINEGYKEVIVSKKRKSDGSCSSSKRRRRWNPRKQVDKHSLGSGLCVQQESLQDREGNFICKKCDEQCNDISSLRTHIGTNHRIKDHYLVCLECGENFVVEPSLQMHLKAFHSIQDPPNYMSQNPGYAKEITESVEDESNTGIANQCHVCMAVFEDKLAVDKHLRVHGMAFLNRKRMEARNAARNPEKRSRIDKPDESLNDNAAATDDQKNEKSENHKVAEIESVNETVRES